MLIHWIGWLIDVREDIESRRIVEDFARWIRVFLWRLVLKDFFEFLLTKIDLIRK